MTSLFQSVLTDLRWRLASVACNVDQRRSPSVITTICCSFFHTTTLAVPLEATTSSTLLCLAKDLNTDTSKKFYVFVFGRHEANTSTSVHSRDTWEKGCEPTDARQSRVSRVARALTQHNRGGNHKNHTRANFSRQEMMILASNLGENEKDCDTEKWQYAQRKRNTGPRHCAMARANVTPEKKRKKEGAFSIRHESTPVGRMNRPVARAKFQIRKCNGEHQSDERVCTSLEAWVRRSSGS